MREVVAMKRETIQVILIISRGKATRLPMDLSK